MDEVVKLDVGGHLYTTTLSTLTRYPETMLGAMFSERMPSARDPNGAYIIDGDGPIFRYVLSFLRRGKLNLPTDFKDWDMLKSEADFYQIKELQDAVTKTTENTSMEFIEIVYRPPYNDYTYHGNHETLKRLPLLLEFLIKHRTEMPLNRYDDYEIMRPPSFWRCHILERVEKDGLFTLHLDDNDLKQRAQHNFGRLWAGIFHEISKLGFKLKTSSSAFLQYEQELRWTFARKIR